LGDARIRLRLVESGLTLQESGFALVQQRLCLLHLLIQVWGFDYSQNLANMHVVPNVNESFFQVSISPGEDRSLGDRRHCSRKLNCN
jgi:hypothetical protein